MVSKARLDLPEPDRPVTTTRLSRGISTRDVLEVVDARALDGDRRARGGSLASSRRRTRRHGVASAARSTRQVDERQLLHVDVAPLRQPHRRSTTLPISPWSARYSHAVVTLADVEVPLEVILDLAARARFAGLAQVVDDRREQRRRPRGQVAIDRVERRLRRSSRSSSR